MYPVWLFVKPNGVQKDKSGLMWYISLMTTRIKRRKPANERRDVYLRVRITEEQQELLKAAAKHTGVTVSAWCVMELLRAARREPT